MVVMCESVTDTVLFLFGVRQLFVCREWIFVNSWHYRGAVNESRRGSGTDRNERGLRAPRVSYLLRTGAMWRLCSGAYTARRGGGGPEGQGAPLALRSARHSRCERHPSDPCPLSSPRDSVNRATEQSQCKNKAGDRRRRPKLYLNDSTESGPNSPRTLSDMRLST